MGRPGVTTSVLLLICVGARAIDYGLIVDAGSSGSRMRIFTHESTPDEPLPVINQVVPDDEACRANPIGWHSASDRPQAPQTGRKP